MFMGTLLIDPNVIFIVPLFLVDPVMFIVVLLCIYPNIVHSGPTFYISYFVHVKFVLKSRKVQHINHCQC